MEKPSPEVWKDEMLAILASVSHPQELKRRCFARFSCCTLIILKELDICLDWMLCICVSIAFVFNKCGPFFWGEQNSDTKVAPSALGDERSNVEGVSNVKPLFRFSQLLGVRNGEMVWMEMDGEME